MVFSKDFIAASYYEAREEMDHEQAIAFVAACTGQDEATVEAVLGEEVGGVKASMLFGSVKGAGGKRLASGCSTTPKSTLAELAEAHRVSVRHLVALMRHYPGLDAEPSSGRKKYYDPRKFESWWCAVPTNASKEAA